MCLPGTTVYRDDIFSTSISEQLNMFYFKNKREDQLNLSRTLNHICCVKSELKERWMNPKEEITCIFIFFLIAYLSGQIFQHTV